MTMFLLFVILLKATNAALLYDEPSWYSRIEKEFGTERVKRCKKRLDVAPTDGSPCMSTRPKTCFFGTQPCFVDEPNPATVCRCPGVENATWVCEPLVCRPELSTSFFVNGTFVGGAAAGRGIHTVPAVTPTPSPITAPAPVDQSTPSLHVAPMLPLPVVPDANTSTTAADTDTETPLSNEKLSRNSASRCGDAHVNCGGWAFSGQCQANPGYMKAICAKSCGNCGPCSNTDNQCSGWAAIGECHTNPGFMLTQCASSCNSCEDKTARIATGLSWRFLNPDVAPFIARALITDAMNKAVERYNKLYRWEARILDVEYNHEVATADGTILGKIRFGPRKVMMNERSALHEIAHTFGVGDYLGYNGNGNFKWRYPLVNGDKFTGQRANALVHQYDGPHAVIFTDVYHFFPYNLNYDNEMSEVNADRHVHMVRAMALDGLYPIPVELQ